MLIGVRMRLPFLRVTMVSLPPLVCLDMLLEPRGCEGAVPCLLRGIPFFLLGRLCGGRAACVPCHQLMNWS